MESRVLWARHMATSPYTFFSQDNTIITHTIQVEDPPKPDYLNRYKNCQECYDFSMMFGGCYVKGKQSNRRIKAI